MTENSAFTPDELREFGIENDQLGKFPSSNGAADRNGQNGHHDGAVENHQHQKHGHRGSAKAAVVVSATDDLLERPLICNAERVGSGEDAEMHVRSMADIIDQILTAADGWPRRVDDSLFIDDHRHGLKHLQKCAELGGWIHSLAGVRWYQSTGCVSREELFSELQRTAQPYRAIEAYPHFPPLVDHYYSHPPIEPGDGATLHALLDLFCPATPIDLDLILSLFATAAWGGAGGTRPVYVIASEYGRGVGKTKLLELLGIVFGGMFSISQTDSAAQIVKRLLTPAAATKRITCYDNVKTNKLSWAEYESLVTTREISGHQLYHGERTRPNTILHTLTLNGPSMSRDMAQRSIVIKLGRPLHTGNWEDDAKAFVESNRWQIIADLAAFFLRPPAPLEHYTRWGTWEREVLARLPEPADAQRVISERQGEINADDEETATLADQFRQELERLGYSTETDNVHIPNELARDWYNRATGETATTTAVTRTIRQAHDEGMLPQVKVNPCRTNGRGFLWIGSLDEPVRYDVIERQRANGWQEQNRHWDR